MRALPLALLAVAASAQDAPETVPRPARPAARCEAHDPLPTPFSDDARPVPMPTMDLDGPAPAPMPNLCGPSAPLAMRLDGFEGIPRPGARPPAGLRLDDLPGGAGLLRQRALDSPALQYDVPLDGRRWLRDADPRTLDDRALAYPDPLDRPFPLVRPPASFDPGRALDASLLHLPAPVAPPDGGE